MSDLRQQLQESLAAKYRVNRELTGGGMSRVFLSEDVTLEREVVVKVLSPELVDEARVERFRQEVLQTARLQHPTIVPLLEVGAVAIDHGRHVPFYIMPYVRGESLRSRMRHDGPLSVGLSLRILRSALDALAHAHAHGVVHRDIKPENIFLSGTTAVLADFGIAKAIAGPGSRAGITAEGMTVGTLPYTAPEQLIGGEVDARADLHALGVVAYEMLTGHKPWGRATSVETLASQARGQHKPLRSFRPDVPAELAAAIESCLEWSPAKRPASAESLLQVIEAIPITPSDSYGVPKILGGVRRWRSSRSLMVAALAGLVVLVAGFMMLTRRRDTGHVVKLAIIYPELAAGSAATAEQLFHFLAADLNGLSGLRLFGQVSVPEMRKSGLAPRQIVDSLRAQGADSALVFRAHEASGGGYLLSLDLQQFRTGKEEMLAGPVPVGSLTAIVPDSLRSLVNILAAQVVTKLHLTSATHTVNESEAVDAFLAWSRGRDAYAQRSPNGLATAVQWFGRAITLDSMYAQPHAELAQTIALSLFYKYRREAPPYEIAARALSLADRAIQLQPSFGDGYLARGYLGSVVGAPVEFIEANFRKAQTLTSANPWSQVWYAMLFASRGDFEGAYNLLEREVQLDQRSPAQRIASSLYSLPLKRSLNAVREASAARALVPDIPMTAQLELLGRLQLGGRALDECTSVAAGPYLGLRALCLERLGRTAESRAAADSLFAIVTGKAAGDTTFDQSLYIMEMATYYAARKEPDAARQWLRQAMLESPAAIDIRLIRAGLFDPALIAYGDSLRAEAWTRVLALARRP